MSRNELLHQLRVLSSGTIAHLIGDCRYKAIDAAQAAWLDIAADELSADELKSIHSWMDFVNQILPA